MRYQLVPVQGFSPESRRKRMPPRSPASLRGRLSFLPCQLAVAVICLLFWPGASLFASADSKAVATPCDYYTKEDAQKLFGVSVSGPIQTKTSLPAGQRRNRIWPYAEQIPHTLLLTGAFSPVASEVSRPGSLNRNSHNHTYRTILIAE
jgi:hypothetical protein